MTTKMETTTDKACQMADGLKVVRKDQLGLNHLIAHRSTRDSILIFPLYHTFPLMYTAGLFDFFTGDL